MIKPDYVTLFLPPLFFLVTGEPLNREKLRENLLSAAKLKAKGGKKNSFPNLRDSWWSFGNFFADQMVITARELTSDDGIQL